MMINFDSLTLKLFKEENKEFLLNSRLQKIQQPARNELIFSIRNKNESKKLYINFNPNFYHICFMSALNEQKRNITIPKTAPMFCMLLRKYIQNAKVINVNVPEYERIFELYFEYYDELNEKSILCLAIELMGKYSNVILYNYDTNVIIGCAHNVSSEKSRERELYGMLPYIYPPKQKKKNLLKVSFDSFLENLDENDIPKSISNKYNYITIPVASQFYSESQSVNVLYNKLQNFLFQKEYKPYISSDFSKYFLFEFENSQICESINEMIDNYFAYHQSKYTESNLKSKISKYIQLRLTKLNILKTKQEEQIKKLDKAKEYKNKADIIMANLYYLKDGIKKASLYDFDGNSINIEFDENLSVKENANRYYALYKKTKSAYEHAKNMIEETISEILYYEEVLFFSQQTQSIDELKDIYSELNNEKSTKDLNNESVNYIEYEGYKIYAGKNKKQNDYILSKISSPDDIWLHPLNAPGAHIIVKNPNPKTDIPDSVLLKAAQITKDFSSQKNNSKTSIIYTKRKYVKKAANKVAFVTYKNESEIIV